MSHKIFGEPEKIHDGSFFGNLIRKFFIFGIVALVIVVAIAYET